jgi:hypothetical protein
MPSESIDVTARVSNVQSWTATGGDLHTVLSDADNGTYARSNNAGVRVVLRCENPAPPGGRLVSVCPFVRSKKEGYRTAKALVCTHYNSKIASRGVYLNIPHGADAGNHELPAHRGCHNLGWAQAVGGPIGLDGRPATHVMTADDAALGLSDSSAAAGRAYVYRAYLKLYYLLEATIDAPDAPTGTISDTQMPTCTVGINTVVETWQVPTDEEPWLCEGDVEYRIYDAADIPGGSTAPPSSSLATPLWSDFARFIDMAYSDGTTPTAQDVSIEPDVRLENGDYILFTRVSRDVPEGSQLYWSDWSQEPFTIDVDLPTTPTLVVTTDDAEQRVDIALHVDATALYNGDAVTALVERSDDAGVTWETVRGCADVAVIVGDNALASDYEAARGVALSYRARIVDVLTSDSTELSSDWASDTCTGPALVGWNLKVPSNEELNWLAAPIKQNPQAEREQLVTIFRPLGRGSAVSVSGASAGELGTLEITARDADEIDDLVAIVECNDVLYVETAFGDAFYARVIKPSWMRAGTLVAPRRPYGLEYAEVGRPPVA